MTPVNKSGGEYEKFFVNANDDEPAPAKAQNPVQANVYLFSHGWCASACLDFADLYLRHGRHPTYWLLYEF